MNHDTCDCSSAGQLDRRGFLRLSFGGALGLALSGLGANAFAQERTGRVPGRGQAEHCVILWMSGGMSQTDTFDPKPGSRSSGPLRAIPTAQPGVKLSEWLPGLSEELQSVALVRSMLTREGAHDRARYLLHTGYAPNGTVAHPDLGALIAQGLPDAELDLPAYTTINGTGIGPGILGVEYAPFAVGDPTRPVDNMTYGTGVDAERFDRRRRLLEAVERRFRRDHPGEETEGHTSVYVKADRMMHSPQTQAFDLSSESATLRDAYGRNRFGQGCLMARRLIENGVKVVEVQLGGWDTHQDNFTRGRDLATQLDNGFSTLIRDLREKELLRKTMIVCMTEFGRTPGVNENEGRDHFARGWSVALAGGPVKPVVVGQTSDDGMNVVEDPLTAADLLKSVGHAMGLDLDQQNYSREGRPIQAFPAEGKIIRKLFEE
ncbi:DUF1501 domain-containing protein [Planctomycetota bacterium]|nr:DUF1501 domain-containing protein [Planctomycetota bacterium]